tara:strand:- start:2518 stop:2664 length:147 start_codon:yes stop_codon:yes gene_type:complete
MSIIQSGWVLAGIFLVAGVSKLIMMDGIGWVSERAGKYMEGAGSGPFG